MKTGQGALEAALLDIVGREGLVPADELSAYAVDGRVPVAAVRPASVAEVAQVMALAHRRGLAVVPWGGGTMMGLGNAPARYHLALDLRRLNRVVEHEPADLTITVEAGIDVAALQEYLAGHRQMAPLEPPRPQQATVGGTLAAAAVGPARLSLGRPRDVTIGIKVVMADGRVTKAGGKVVKNVAGYDLCKLYVGSLGTLAVIVEASFKLLPQPRLQEALAFAFPDPSAACKAASQAWRRHLALRSLAVQRQKEGPFVLVAHLAGGEAAVARSHQELSHLAAGLEGQATTAREVWEDLVASPPVAQALVVRASVLPAQVPECMARLASLAPDAMVAIPLAGVVLARWPADADVRALVARAREAVASMGGTTVVQQCPLPAKEEMDVFGPLPPSFPIMKAVKGRWDPKGVLSPGRFVGRL